MTRSPSLTTEWERIDLLSACLAACRRGEEVPSELKQRLQEAQVQVQALRQQSPWQELIGRYGLSAIDQDILACVVAPEAEPRLGWIFQQLQSGMASPYPTPAFMCELFFLDGREAELFYGRLAQGAPLIRAGLLDAHGGQLYQPLRPRPRANEELLGWSPLTEAPPGAVPLDAAATWEDLVLPPACMRTLREFLLWITHRDQVANAWGARLLGGPVALFAGPSGTGKTFAAEVLANALDWPLFRVDLGQLVSKYIGETEKNLNALFDAAHGQTMVLLFDEADSLFGKRGEIKEARDRYSNMEVSHLLARVERHQGPCILTSNMRRHLDPAFARRFQVVVEFPRPDAVARETLWRQHLPPRAPQAPELAKLQLGQALSLTGGQIRNAALHAAFLAAGEGRSISPGHIARAVWLELAKEGHEIRRSSLGGLVNYLPEEESYAEH